MNRKRSEKNILFSVIAVFLILTLTGCISKSVKDKDEKGNSTENIDNKDDKLNKNQMSKDNNDSSSSVSKDTDSKNKLDSSELDKYKKFTGKYKLKVIGFNGELIIKIEENSFSGTIFFRGWGRGIPQPLKNLIIKGSKIHFIRSITTKKEMKEFGSKSFFTQKYVGSFSKDGKTIKGSYVSSGLITNWKAYR